MRTHDDDAAICCHDDVAEHCPTCYPRRSPYELHAMPDWFRDTYRKVRGQHTMSTHTEPSARIDCTVGELYATLGQANGTVAEYVVRRLGQAGHVVRQLDTHDDTAADLEQADPGDTAPSELHKRSTGKRASGKRKA